MEINKQLIWYRFECIDSRTYAALAQFYSLMAEGLWFKFLLVGYSL